MCAQSSDKAFQHCTDVKETKPEMSGRGSRERTSCAPTRAPRAPCRDAVSDDAEQQQEQCQRVPDESRTLPVPSCFQDFGAEEHSGTAKTPPLCTQAGLTRKNQECYQTTPCPELRPSGTARGHASILLPPTQAGMPGASWTTLLQEITAAAGGRCSRTERKTCPRAN